MRKNKKIKIYKNRQTIKNSLRQHENGKVDKNPNILHETG